MWICVDLYGSLWMCMDLCLAVLVCFGAGLALGKGSTAPGRRSGEDHVCQAMKNDLAQAGIFPWAQAGEGALCSALPVLR